MKLDDFVAAWNSFALTFAKLAEEDPKGAGEALRMALNHGLEALAPALPPVSEKEIDTLVGHAALQQAAYSVVATSGYFDGKAYRRARRPAGQQRPSFTGDDEAIYQYTHRGWRILQSPRPDFDVWWYWNEYLDPRRELVDPFVHYLLEGRFRGYATHQERQELRPDPPSFAGRTPRRVCLFAGYNKDGVIDDYVVRFLEELDRYSDVYYLADNDLSADELAKLAHCTVKAWGRRHGRYDFGSYSVLASELVGWEELETYDEVLLVNDSTMLVRPLGPVFERMDALACDWWGLQAAKLDYDPWFGHVEAIPLSEGKTLLLDTEWWDYWHRMHISSYFLAYRGRVIRDGGLRARLENVAVEYEKYTIVKKYEMGISDYLIRSGYPFETFTGMLHAGQPMYTTEFYDLIAEGFPVIKRAVLEGKHGLHLIIDWQDRLRAAAPDAPIAEMEATIARLTADEDD